MTTGFNMEFSQRLVIATDKLDWQTTALPGVERRKLERENAESGRATTIVRYVPGSNFTPHVHAGGEEYLVLDGVFSDEFGDFGPGMYVRNPVGSKHQPFSEPGCTIFVKFGQMDARDQEIVRIATSSEAWFPGPAAGLTVLPLHAYENAHIALVRWARGSAYQHHVHPGGEEILVLAGEFRDENGRYAAGTWLRNPAGSEHSPFSTEGCTIYVKTGHLPLVATSGNRNNPSKESSHAKIHH